jgi:hypothetical protein
MCKILASFTLNNSKNKTFKVLQRDAIRYLCTVIFIDDNSNDNKKNNNNTAAQVSRVQMKSWAD